MFTLLTQLFEYGPFIMPLTSCLVREDFISLLHFRENFRSLCSILALEPVGVVFQNQLAVGFAYREVICILIYAQRLVRVGEPMVLHDDRTFALAKSRRQLDVVVKKEPLQARMLVREWLCKSYSSTMSLLNHRHRYP